MPTPLDDLLTDLTPEEIFDDLLAIAKALGLSTTAWQPGEPIRGVMSVFSRWTAPLWNGQVLPALRALFLDKASGDWLTLGAWAFYKVYRKEATFASGPAITVENQEGGFWEINPGDIRFEVAGKTYTNIDGGTLAAWTGTGAFPVVNLHFVADEAGTDSDLDLADVPVYPDVPLLAPGAGIYLRAGEGMLLGQDEEEDDDLKERCRLSTGPLSPAGPRAAYQYVALSTRRPAADEAVTIERLLVSQAGDIGVNVNRALVRNLGGGVIDVRLASPSGAASGDVATAGTDVYLVNQAIQLLVVPMGLTANVASADEDPLAITLELDVLRESNVTAAAAKAAAEKAVNDFFRRFPIGGRKVAESSVRFVVMHEVRAIAKAASPGIYRVRSTPDDDHSILVTDVVVPSVTATATLVEQ
ncbi:MULTISPECIES: baseplate J/gp47 family protein [Sorangium]|uniref:baseplate J/gp47 family protein n=1 Tax=Sorangium TaxID=39643 RepID=UPI003D9C2BB5